MEYFKEVGVFRMLANNLKVLLAERNLRIKDVVEDTSLSRNTVSNIANNPCSNVSNSTLDELCNYLNIEPQDFYTFSPYLIKYLPGDFSLLVTHKKRNYKIRLQLKKISLSDLNEEKSETLKDIFKNDVKEIENRFSIFKLRVLKNENFDFIDMYNNVSFVFQNEIRHNITDLCVDYLTDFYTAHEELPENTYIDFFNGGELIIPKNNFEN